MHPRATHEFMRLKSALTHPGHNWVLGKIMHGAAGKGVEGKEILEVADAPLHPILRDTIAAE